MKRFWDRRGDPFDLEEALRAARPRAREELVRAIAARVRKGRAPIRSPRLGLAAALSIGMLVAFGAVGGLSYAASATIQVAKAVARAAAPPSAPKANESKGKSEDKQNEGQNKKNEQQQQQVQVQKVKAEGPITALSTTSITVQDEENRPALTCSVPTGTPNLSAFFTVGDDVEIECFTGGPLGSQIVLTKIENAVEIVTPARAQYKPGKGCGDKNHVHFKEGQCKPPNPK